MQITKRVILSGRPRDGAIYNAGQIRKYLRAFRRSGLSVAAFARQEGLSYYRLRSWLQASRRIAPHAGRPAFQNLPLSSLLGPAWAAEVISPTGLTVRLSAQVPSSLALELVALGCQL